MAGTIADSEEAIRRLCERSGGKADYASRVDQLPELVGMTYEQILDQLRTGKVRLHKFAFEYSGTIERLLSSPSEARIFTILKLLPLVVVAACLVGAVAVQVWSLFLALPLFLVGQFCNRSVKHGMILTVIVAALTIGIGVENRLVRLGLPAAALLFSISPALLRRLYLRVIFGRALESETIFAFLFSVRQIALDIPRGKLVFHRARGDVLAP